jgi:hypothetical protein
MFFALLSTSVTALGLAMPPNTHLQDYIGSNTSFNVMVLNQEGKPGEYSLSFDGSLRNRTTAYPSKMTINPPLDIIHRGNPAQDGFENVQIIVNSKGILPGTYDLVIVAEVHQGAEGTFSIIQRVSRKIQIDYKYPPSFFNKIANSIIIGVKNIWNWFIDSIINIYKKNPWLNYLLMTILFVVIFYIGMNIKKVIRWFKMCFSLIKRKIKRIGNYLKKIRLFKWLKSKNKDRFKKQENRQKEGKRENGQEDNIIS